MSIITLSFDLEKEAAGLPEGLYQFQVTTADATESQAGNDMVKVKLSVVNDPQYNGRTVYDNLVVAASMARRLKAFADSAGLDFRQGINPDDMVGRTVWAEVMHEEYQGEQQAKIRRYRIGK